MNNPTTDAGWATNEQGEKVPAMRIQPNPTTSEWTVKQSGSQSWAVYEGSQLIGNAWDKMEAESIAHCHNAALAAAVEALKWYAVATYPDDGSGRPPEAFQRKAKAALAKLEEGK